jgi:hypothetical protein
LQFISSSRVFYLCGAGGRDKPRLSRAERDVLPIALACAAQTDCGIRAHARPYEREEEKYGRRADTVWLKQSKRLKPVHNGGLRRLLLITLQISRACWFEPDLRSCRVLTPGDARARTVRPLCQRSEDVRAANEAPADLPVRAPPAPMRSIRAPSAAAAIPLHGGHARGSAVRSPHQLSLPEHTSISGSQ